jgi:uncharacterized protein YndB with AHSA1/START domain
MTNTMKSKERLQVTTPSAREIAMTRVFAAPRTMVWSALTKPELVKRWLGVRAGWTLPVCEIDLKVGGSYRYVWRGPKGQEMGMGGVYREIVAPERIVATEVFDQKWYDGDALDTTVLVEKGGKTTLTTTVLYASQKVRDAVLESPMKEGVGEGYEKLEEVLASIAARGVK